MSATTASQRGRANRRYGNETARAARDYLRAWWPDIDYTHPGGPTRNHDDDRGDLAPLIDRDGDHWTVEVKGSRSTVAIGQVEAWAREAATEADANGRGGLWVLVVRRPGCADVGRWEAVLPLWMHAEALLRFFGAPQPVTGDDLVRVTVRSFVALVAPETDR